MVNLAAVVCYRDVLGLVVVAPLHCHVQETYTAFKFEILWWLFLL